MPLVFSEKKKIQELANKARKIDVIRTGLIFKYKKVELIKTELLGACALGLGLNHNESMKLTELSQSGLARARKRLADKLDIDINNLADLAVSSAYLCLNGDFL